MSRILLLLSILATTAGMSEAKDGYEPLHAGVWRLVTAGGQCTVSLFREPIDETADALSVDKDCAVSAMLDAAAWRVGANGSLSIVTAQNQEVVTLLPSPSEDRFDGTLDSEPIRFERSYTRMDDPNWRFDGIWTIYDSGTVAGICILTLTAKQTFDGVPKKFGSVRSSEGCANAYDFVPTLISYGTTAEGGLKLYNSKPLYAPEFALADKNGVMPATLPDGRVVSFARSGNAVNGPESALTGRWLMFDSDGAAGQCVLILTPYALSDYAPEVAGYRLEQATACSDTRKWLKDVVGWNASAGPAIFLVDQRGRPVMTFRPAPYGTPPTDWLAFEGRPSDEEQPAENLVQHKRWE